MDRIARIILRCALLPIALGALGAGANDAPAYRIRFERPYKAGDTFEQTLQVESQIVRRVTEVGAEPRAQEESLKGEFLGRTVIRQVDAGGNATALTLTVRRFVTGDAGQTAVPPGASIDIQRSVTGASFTARDGRNNELQIPEDARKVLAQVYPAIKDRQAAGGDDASMGSPVPRRVGDSWPVRTERFLDPKALDADPRNITGTTTFKALETVRGAEAMRLVQTFRVTDFKAALPPDYLLDRSGMVIELTTLVPVDVTLAALELASSTRMEFAAHHSTGGTQVHITQSLSTRQTFVPIAPAARP